MGLWHVFYEDWQMECCGTPFSVGDEVSWPLLLLDPDTVLGGGWRDQLSEVAGPVEDVGGVRMVREETGLPVALGADPDAEEDRRPKPGSRTRSAGLLSVERHGARWPEAGGRVRAVQVLTQTWAETAPGSRSYEPVAGRRGLRAVVHRDRDRGRADGRRAGAALARIGRGGDPGRAGHGLPALPRRPRGPRHPGAERGARRGDPGHRGGGPGGPASDAEHGDAAAATGPAPPRGCVNGPAMPPTHSPRPEGPAPPGRRGLGVPRGWGSGSAVSGRRDFGVLCRFVKGPVVSGGCGIDVPRGWRSGSAVSGVTVARAPSHRSERSAVSGVAEGSGVPRRSSEGSCHVRLP